MDSNPFNFSLIVALKWMLRSSNKAKKIIQESVLQPLDYFKTTFSLSASPNGRIVGHSFDFYYHNVRLNFVAAHAFVRHRFDILGSGWVSVSFGLPITADELRFQVTNKDRVNSANLAESQRIGMLLDEKYSPIDWQKDLRSGYNWKKGTWYCDIPVAPEHGVDIKVPWELSRAHHLATLAFAYAAMGRGDAGGHPAGDYAHEFRNQILDFIAANPPRFGVNWACTMDVGIRVANWLVAYDLFLSFGARFDSEFEEVFSRSVYEHGLHIVNNLEWAPHFRSNHYLANIVGLLFVSVHLSQSSETDAWLAFAVQELIEEVALQFNADGSNFEASTSYHRLSAEMVVYATALILGLPQKRKAALKKYDSRLITGRPRLQPGPLPFYQYEKLVSEIPFPEWYIERLEKMAEFTMHITRPDGRVPQFGDNDSGRFLKLQPIFESMSVAEAKARFLNLREYSGRPDDAVHLEEDHLDHRHLVAAVNGLFEREDFTGFSRGFSADTDAIIALSGGIRLPSCRSMVERTSPLKDNSLPENRLFPYPDFGLYVYRSSKVYLAVRCGHVGQGGIGGHSHNDQLSFELALNGKTLIVDPGTYLYTPAPEQRNRFRSCSKHNALVFPDKEPNEWRPGQRGLFVLHDNANPKVISISENQFCGEHQGFGDICRRTLKINDFGVTGWDECASTGIRYLNFHFASDVELLKVRSGDAISVHCEGDHFSLMAEGGVWRVEGYRYSPSYGVVELAQKAVFETCNNTINWSITKN